MPRQSVAESIPLDRVMAAILGVLIADREDRIAASDGKGREIPRRIELILADAGLSVQQISALLNKKPDTVAKSISRSRSRASSDGDANG